MPVSPACVIQPSSTRACRLFILSPFASEAGFFVSRGFFKHRFDSALPLPAERTVNRPKARKLPRPARATIPALHGPAVIPAALRRAIEDLTRKFGASYANGNRQVTQLAELESAATAQLDIRRKFITLQRKALFANPTCSKNRAGGASTGGLVAPTAQARCGG